MWEIKELAMRVTERKFFVRQIFVAAAMFAGMFFLGCEIGLGPAVDTEAPEAFITYPEVSTAAKGTITLSGTCTDDTIVEKVIIKSLYSADNQSLSFPADRTSVDAAPLASVKPNGENWDIPLEYDSATGTYSIGGTYLGYLPDGTYVVDVVAEDGFRKSTPASRSFDIDNTPPVFLLSNPTSLEGMAGSPYGRIVKVTGTIADSHSIEKMEIVAYNAGGDPISLSKTEFSGFDKANTAVVIAHYSADDESGFSALDETDKALQRNYVALMGETGNILQNAPSSYESVTVNIAVKLTDKAGNVSEYSYITSPLAAISGPLAGRAVDKPFEAIDYMNILNGTYTGAGRDEVKNVLLGNGDNTTYKYLSHDRSTADHSWLSMAVSPNNAPTFSVGDCDLKDRELTGTWNGISNQSTLSIDVNAGRDKVAFDPKELSVKIYQAASDGSFVQDGEPVATFSKDNDSQYTDDNKKPFTDTNNANVFTLSTRQDGTFRLHLPESLTLIVGQKYYIVVEGCDTQGVDIVPQSYRGYGFSIASNGSAPSVECDDAKKYYKASDLYENSANGKLEITIKDKDTDLKTVAVAADKGVVEYEVRYYSGKHNSLDVITTNRLTPVAEGNAYNGKLHPNDLGLIEAGQKKWRTYIPLGTCPAGENNYTIVVKLRTFNGSTLGDWVSYIVYADGKKPAISVTNEELLGSTKKITPYSSGYKSSTDDSGNPVYKYRLAGKMSDIGGSGVKKITIEYNDETPIVLDEPNIVDEFGWNCDLTVHEGKNQKIRITANDLVGNAITPILLENITMDFNPPEIKLIQVNGTAVENNSVNQYYTSKPVALKFKGEDKIGETSEDIATDKLTISRIIKDGTVVPSGYSFTTATAAKTLSINEDGQWEVHAYATDSSGQNSNELVLKTTVDTTKPVISGISIMGTDRNNYYANDTLQFKITYTETLSGLAKAGFSIHTPDMSASSWTSEDDTTELAGKGTSVETSITASGFESTKGGTNKLKVWLYDAAGNKSEPFEVDVNIDKTPPELAAGWLGKSESVLEEIPGTVYHKGTVTLYGTVSDEGGVAPLTFMNGGTDIENGTTTVDLRYSTSSALDINDKDTFSQLSANWQQYSSISNKYDIKGWKAVISNPPDGKLSIVAEDMAGQTTSVSNFVNLVKDTDAPNLRVTNLVSNGTIKETDLSDNKFTLRGTWNDLKDEGDPASGGSGTKTLTCKVGSTNVPVTSSSAPQTTASANWSIELPKDVLGLGNIADIVLEATDNVENKKTVTITGVVADYQKPTIALSKVDGVAATKCDELYGESASNLVLEISAADDWGIQKIEVVDAKLNNSAYALGGKFAYTMGEDKATITLPRDGSCDGLWTITLRATDRANRTSDTYTITTRIDGTKPTLDSGAFKIGGVAHNADKWYNGKILKVGTTASDEATGSGLDTVYYKVVQNSDSTIYENIKDSMNGSLGLSGASRNFELTVEGLSDSNVDNKNKLLLQVSDKAGNMSDVLPFIVAVDETLPNIESKSFTYNGTDYKTANGTIVTNGQNDMTLYADVNDINSALFGIPKIQSGVESVALKLVGSNGSETDLEAAITYSSSPYAGSSNIGGMSFSDSVGAQNRKSMKAVIDKSKLGSGSVKAIVTDVAGNKTNQILFSLAMDNDPPEIELKNPATVLIKEDGAVKSVGELGKVDGSITIEGTASDPSLDKVDVYTSIGDQDHFTLCNMGSGSSLYNWKTQPIQMSWVDGENLMMIGGNAYNGSTLDVFLKVVASDTAGNVKEKIYKYCVDPENDRPIVEVSNVSLIDSKTQVVMSDTNFVWCRFDTIYGIVSDDDGMVKSMKYRVGDSGSFIPVTSFSNGSWSIKLEDEGVNKVYFQIEDANGSTFTSSLTSENPNQYTSPKLKNDTTMLERNSVLNMKLDLSAPEIRKLEYQTSADGLTWNDSSSDFTGGSFGGLKYKYVRLSFEAKDTNGIRDVSFALDDSTHSMDVASTEAANDGFTKYVSGMFNLRDDYESGTHTVLVSATDNADISKKPENPGRFNVDNDVPSVTIRSGTRGIVSDSSTIYGQIDDASETNVFYTVTRNDVAPADIGSAALSSDAAYAVGGWKQVADATIAYTILFDGGSTDPSDTRTHTALFKNYLTENALNITTLAAIQDGTYTETPDVDVHVLVRDKCGNETVVKFDVQVDPTGDRPTTSITMPSNNSILGGKITVYGSATDMRGANPGIQGVGIMMDVNSDGSWTKDDADLIHDRAEALVSAGKLDSDKNYRWAMFDRSDNPQFREINYSKITADNISKCCLMADVEGSVWSILINRAEEFNPEEGQQQSIKVWAFAVDNDGFTSPMDFTDNMPNVQFMIDAHAPKLDNERLTKEGLERAYIEGIPLKGEWIYEADIYDDVGISKIELNGIPIVTNESPVSPLPSAVNGVAPINDSANGRYGFHIAFKVGSGTDDEVSSQTFVVKYTEKKDGGSATAQTREVKINIDNKAPEIAPKIINDTPNPAFNIGKGRVVNSGRFYTFGSKAMEPTVNGVSQTGVSKIAFYITRDVGGISSLYDPMIARGNSSHEIANYSGTGSGWAFNGDDHLYWTERTVSEDSTTNSVKINTADPHIHVGGLVKIHGVIYRIKSVSESVSGTTITLGTNDEDTPVSVSSGEKIYFALANVVDNNVQEGDGSEEDGAGYYTNPSYDDGDKMIESLVKQGSTWTWEANINTKNIGDGLATLHYVVFDEAGNCSYDSVEIFIANNQPRIAGITVKTDTNGSGEYESVPTEVKSLSYANGLDADTNRMITSVLFPVGSTKENPVSLFTIRNKMAIVPEIVGGNGSLSYTMALQKYVDSSTGWAVAYKEFDSEELKNSEGAATTGTVDDYDNPAVGFIEFEPFEMVTKGFQDGNHQKVSMVINDSTPGSNSSDDSKSMKVEITLVLDFKLHDLTPPNVMIKPLYWNSKDDNSLFGNSSKNGHIELPGDLPATGFDASGEYDKDPKVSGKIRIDGVAQDNALLTNIKIDMFGKTGLTVGSFNGTWQVETPLVEGAIPSGGYAFDVTEDVSYGELLAVGIIPSIPAGKRAEDLVPQYGDYGHVAKWTAYIDTETIMETKAADSNQTVVVYASDRGRNPISGGYDDPNTSVPGAVQSGGDDGSDEATGFYRLDVVPYITGVTTKLSAIKRSNPSVYARTAQGHYAVADKEEITISGFNLAGGTITYAKEGGTVTDSYTGAAKAIPETAKSGEVSISVGSMVSLNNMNNNDAKGSYTGTVNLSVKPAGDKSIYDNYYNRQPNGDNNNLLTDDLELDVWEFDPEAVKPKVGSIEHPVMAINPKDKNIGFAFVGGTAYFSMPYGTNSKNVSPNSFEYWIGGLDAWNSVSMAYDVNGYSYGTAAGGDLNTSKHGVDIFRFTTSRWDGKGTLTTEGYKDLNNQFGLEYIGEREYFIDDDGSWTDFTNFSKERIKSPSLCTVSSTSDTSQATLYLAYYDAINDEVRFDWGIIKNTKDGSDDVGMFKTGYGTGRVSTSYSIANTSLIAGQTVNKAISTTPTYASSPVKTTGGQSVYAGEYVSIAAIPNAGINDDAVVAVWWDGTHHKMLYSYNKTPKSIQKGKYNQADTKWNPPEELFPQEVGEYCKVIADGNGGVHIAAYDCTNGDIWYAYLSAYDSPSTAKTGCLDSNGFVGSELNIDVALVNGNPVPYVSYFSSNTAKPKIASWVGGVLSEAASVAGSKDDAFTSNWEIGLIPTVSTLTQDHINVGVWKTEEGALASSVTGTKSFTSKAGATKNSFGTVWGNGSSNPVLGYATKDGSLGYIETAQMK